MLFFSESGVDNGRQKHGNCDRLGVPHVHHQHGTLLISYAWAATTTSTSEPIAQQLRRLGKNEDFVKNRNGNSYLNELLNNPSNICARVTQSRSVSEIRLCRSQDLVKTGRRMFTEPINE
jgi:hypothetical protein